jgi:hypothetical protein
VGEAFLSARIHVELLGGVLYHGLQWGWWLAVGWTHESSIRVAPPGWEAQAAKVVGNEFKATKANGFATGEATACQTFTIAEDDERRWGNHQNIQRKSTLQIHIPGAPTISVFYTSKLRGGQDHTFQFWGGLVNYEAHYDLSRFRPLLKGNSPMSSGFILKMNMYYKGVSRELEKFMWWKREMDLVPRA